MLRRAQWLVFRNDGVATAAAYAQEAAAATAAGRSVGVPNFLDRMDPEKPLARRRTFVLRIMRQAMKARQTISLLCCS